MNANCASIEVDPRLLARLNCPLAEIGKLCEKFRIEELSVFGSAVRDDFKPLQSDLDFLVQFKPESHPTFHELFDIGEALSELTGKKVDVVPKSGLKETIRKEVLTESQVIYAER